jgi:ketopantoate hydroxymethyltransferase
MRTGKHDHICPKRKRRIKKQYAKTAKNRVKGVDQKQKWKADVREMRFPQEDDGFSKMSSVPEGSMFLGQGLLSL